MSHTNCTCPNCVPDKPRGALGKMELDRQLYGIGFAEVNLKKGKVVIDHIPIDEVYKKPSVLNRILGFFKLKYSWPGGTSE